MRRSNLVTRGIILSAIAAMALGAAVSADDTTLEFQQWWGVELPDGALQEICDGFTEETGVKIDLLSNPYADTKTQIAAGAAAGTMADVVGLDGSWVYDFAKQGSIANLTELMEAEGYDDSQLSAQIKYEGNTYMIPVVNFAYPLHGQSSWMHVTRSQPIETKQHMLFHFLQKHRMVSRTSSAHGCGLQAEISFRMASRL